jgi:hypothetical protein
MTNVNHHQLDDDERKVAAETEARHKEALGHPIRRWQNPAIPRPTIR